ncbi:uncharacterized protein LOC134292936 isoform X2 [Anolis carolinensis]|uniref:uncharacterized protein LOC134292936 isoform X2 n=1 Tax=Anolis carolinensis TaxID=28377 RepID=UPI002F2B4A94
METPRQIGKPVMEILGEFDTESPLYLSFCQRVSPQDFEKQSLSYTQISLQDLYTEIERNPQICEPVLQKRRQQRATEETSLTSYLKAKFSSLFNYTTPMGMQELREEAEQLKQEMQRARNYALAAKWTSSWPLEQREWTSSHFDPNPASMVELTPPPMPRIFGPYPSPAERNPSSSNLSQPSPLPVNQKSMVDHHPLMLNPGEHHSLFLGFDPLYWTKDSCFSRTMVSHPAGSLTPEDDTKEKDIASPDPRPPAA